MERTEKQMGDNSSTVCFQQKSCNNKIREKGRDQNLIPEKQTITSSLEYSFRKEQHCKKQRKQYERQKHRKPPFTKIFYEKKKETIPELWKYDIVKCKVF